MKLSPYVDELALYDVVNTPGVATDLSHISTTAVRKKEAYAGREDVGGRTHTHTHRERERERERELTPVVESYRLSPQG